MSGAELTKPRRLLLKLLADAGGELHFDKMSAPSKRLAGQMWPLVRKRFKAYSGFFCEITPDGRAALLAERES